MNICVILPTFNEKDNLPQMVKNIMALKVPGLGVIVVDDNSPDGTGQVADGLAHKYAAKMWVMHRSGKLGLGTAYVEGMTKAKKLGAQIIITMDADFSHDPVEIPKLLKLLKLPKVDVVIGSRHVPGGNILGFGWFRNSLTRTAQFLAKTVLSLPVADSTSAYRAYKREVLEAINIGSIKSSGYSFLIEIIYRVHKAGFGIVESPITFGLRNSGESKVSTSEIWKALGTVWRLRNE